MKDRFRIRLDKGVEKKLRGARAKQTPQPRLNDFANHVIKVGLAQIATEIIEPKP